MIEGYELKWMKWKWEGLVGSFAVVLALLLGAAPAALAQAEPAEAITSGPEGLDEMDFSIESKPDRERWDLFTGPLPRAEISSATGILPTGTSGDPILGESEILAAGIIEERVSLFGGVVTRFSGICEFIATEDVSQTHMLFECSHRGENVPSFPAIFTLLHRPWDGTLDAAGNPVLGPEVTVLTVNLDASGNPVDPVFEPPVPPEPPAGSELTLTRTQLRGTRLRVHGVNAVGVVSVTGSTVSTTAREDGSFKLRDPNYSGSCLVEVFDEVGSVFVDLCG